MPCACALHGKLLFISAGTIIIYHVWFQNFVFEASQMCIYTFAAVSAMVFQGVHLRMCGQVLLFSGKRHLRPHLSFLLELHSMTFTSKQPCVAPLQ
jgi:hypothetical protein